MINDKHVFAFILVSNSNAHKIYVKMYIKIYKIMYINSNAHKIYVKMYIKIYKIIYIMNLI